MSDGDDVKIDFSKGMHDTRYHIKFVFPITFTATILSWSMLEYRDQIAPTNGQDVVAKYTIKWITNYLMNAHPKPHVLYV